MSYGTFIANQRQQLYQCLEGGTYSLTQRLSTPVWRSHDAQNGTDYSQRCNKMSKKSWAEHFVHHFFPQINEECQYKKIARQRNTVEGMPSVLQRRYRVDHMPVRGYIRTQLTNKNVFSVIKPCHIVFTYLVSCAGGMFVYVYPMQPK